MIQFLTNNKGERVAVQIPIAEFLKMQEELDELHCIKLYDEAKQAPSNTISLAEVKEALKKRKTA